MKAQFDTGATGTFIKEETAKRLKLPVVRRERRTIKTLNKREVVPCNIYRLTLTDTNVEEESIDRLWLVVRSLKNPEGKFDYKIKKFDAIKLGGVRFRVKDFRCE